MTVRELVSIGLRFFALWLLLAAFQTFEMLMSVQKTLLMQASAVGIGAVVSSVGFVIAILIATAALLWIACRPLGHVITRGAVSPQHVHLTPDGIVVAGCALLGLWGLKESLVPLIRVWVMGMLNSHLSGTPIIEAISTGEKVYAVSQLAELALSLFFIFRPYQISAFVLRAGGKNDPSSTVDSSARDIPQHSESQD